jgi:hypothetical protein
VAPRRFSIAFSSALSVYFGPSQPQRSEPLEQAAVKDARAVLGVEARQLVGAHPRALGARIIRRGQAERDEPAGRGPGEHVEVVGDPCLRPSLGLKPLLDLRDHQSGDQAADAAAVDAQDPELVGRGDKRGLSKTER